MIDSERFSYFFGVDMYSDMHDTREYKEAIKHIGLFKNYSLLRMSFSEAYDLFEDESLDFVYIDGYAHNGEEGGKTIFDWSKKVKVGGVVSGDDYHSDWPLVVESVHEFIESSGFDLYLTTIIENNPYCHYPTWATIKNTPTHELFPSDLLLMKGKKAKRPRKTWIAYFELFLVRFMPSYVVSILKKVKSKREG